MKRITILLVIMTTLAISSTSAQNTSEKEVLFKNGAVKGVFAKGRLQSGKATFDFPLSGRLATIDLHLEGIYQATDADYNFNGILSANDRKFGCQAKIGQYVKSTFTGETKKVENGIKSNPKYYLCLNNYTLNEYHSEKDNGIIKKITLNKASYYADKFDVKVYAEEYSIFYKNGNILISISNREDGLSLAYPGYRAIEYRWPNGDVFTGNAIFGTIIGDLPIMEQIDMLSLQDHFSMTYAIKGIRNGEIKGGCFKLKNGNVIDINTLTNIKDCEEKDCIVFNIQELINSRKNPSEIVAIRDSVVLAQEAKKQRLEAEERRLEEEKKRQEEEKRQERIKKYGEKFALRIEKGEVEIGMTKEMVLESIQNKKKIYNISYNQNQEYWQANRNMAKKYIQYEMPKSAKDVLAGAVVGAMLQSLGLSEDYMKALFKYDYLEFKDGILVGFREWQDLGGSSERNSRNLMHLFGL